MRKTELAEAIKAAKAELAERKPPTLPTVQCHFCPATGQRFVNGPHWTGTEYIRVDVCNDCHDAGKLATAPRRPRQPRAQRQIVATDWNYLVAFTRGRKR